MSDDVIVEQNRAAWDLTAGKYAPDVDADIELLRNGGISLMEPERRLLGDLSGWCGRAVHLQCSHGVDALSLWNMGASEVVGVDISEEMLALAQRKSEALAAPATWIQSDILHAPVELNGTADLVYTGKGALPWMMDLGAWAVVVARILKPGGRLYVFEGHPLDWAWDPHSPEYRLRQDGSGYFSEEVRPNDTFPAGYIEHHAEPGQSVPIARERQWTLGSILNSLIEAGLRLERFEEHPEQFWPLLSEMPEESVRKLPHTYSLLMRK